MLVQNYMSQGKKESKQEKKAADKQSTNLSDSKNEKGLGTPHVRISEKLMKTKKNNRTLEDCEPIMYSNLDPLPYMEYIENDDSILDELDGGSGDGKVRRQISDC